jgi:hypothetical protein
MILLLQTNYYSYNPDWYSEALIRNMQVYDDFKNNNFQYQQFLYWVTCWIRYFSQYTSSLLYFTVKKHLNTQWDILILRMLQKCLWGVESGKLKYSSMFGHVPTCVYMSYRPIESFLPKQQRNQYLSSVYYWRKNDWQESGAADIYKVWCLKISKSASETLALLILSYGG